MIAQLQIERVEKCLLWLESEAENYTETQSIDYLVNQSGMLCSSLAFVNNQMAVAKKHLNEKKVSEYLTLSGSSVANQQYYSPSLAKDYIAAQCSKEQYDYDVCERASRTITHTLDIIRTCISALKHERQYSN